jgi:phosphonoacetate hydrolase
MTRVVVCCDGLDCEYLDATDTPGWETIADDGRHGECASIVPSLTNVNNVSIVTTSFPEIHGITGNTYHNRETDENVYMEDPSFVRTQTWLQRAAERGEAGGALVVKDKLKQMVGQGCELAASAEDPPIWLESAVGEAPDIYSGTASQWLLDAAVYVIETHDLDWLYVSTTDVVPHKHAPEAEYAREWVRAMDEGLSELHERAADIVVTADHGMNQKTLAVDVERLLETNGYSATVIRLIRDKHVYHHQNLGGAAYAYLDGDDTDEVIDMLETTEGIEAALTTEDAAKRFHLPPDRIGDLMVLGTPQSVFGPLDDSTHDTVDVRSHGSSHEQRVPYVTSRDASMEYNIDAFHVLE